MKRRVDSVKWTWLLNTCFVDWSFVQQSIVKSSIVLPQRLFDLFLAGTTSSPWHRHLTSDCYIAGRCSTIRDWTSTHSITSCLSIRILTRVASTTTFSIWRLQRNGGKRIIDYQDYRHPPLRRWNLQTSSVEDSTRPQKRDVRRIWSRRRRHIESITSCRPVQQVIILTWSKSKI